MESNADLVFRVTQESDGGYCAECLTEGIFTQGDTWEELEFMIRDAVDAYFFDDPAPRSISIKLEK
jgi:predicted RNase H-like HicB family nuclease